MPRSESVRSLAVPSCVWLAVLVGASAAAAQNSDSIYNENTFATFRLTMPAADWQKITNDPAGAGDVWQRADMTWDNGAGVVDTVPGVGVKASGASRAPVPRRR